MADGEELRALARNTQHFRSRMSAAGFTLSGQGHAIVPVMLGDAQLAVTMAVKYRKRCLCCLVFLSGCAEGQAYPYECAAHSLEQVDYMTALLMLDES